MAEVIISELILETDDESEDDDSTLVFNTVLKTVMLRESRVRIENYMTEVVSRFSDIEFKRVYRNSVDCFQHICQILSTCPEMDVRSAYFGGRDRITLERTVLVALRYLGHQENIRLLSNIFNISDSSVIVCRERVISALNSMKDRYIAVDLMDPLEIQLNVYNPRGPGPDPDGVAKRDNICRHLH